MRRILLALLTLFAFGSVAYAQSTATPVLPGLLTNVGCPAGYTYCYAPYSNTNPLPVAGTFTPSGTQDTNLKQVNGQTVNVGVGAAGTGTQRVTTSTDSTVGPSQRTLVTLDIKTVTTGGTAVNALSAGHRTAGGFLLNPIGATIALCINEIGTASGTSSSGDTTCIQPGQSYSIAPAAGAVSVISSDSSHPFSGYGLQ